MGKVLGYRSLVEFFPVMHSPGLGYIPQITGKKRGSRKTLKEAQENMKQRQAGQGRGWQRQKQVKPEDPVERGGVSGNVGSSFGPRSQYL